MNFRQKLFYSAFGAAIMLLGILAANHLTPISAPPNPAHFDEIICKRLTVHGKEDYGGVELHLDEKGGAITDRDAATKVEGY